MHIDPIQHAHRHFDRLDKAEAETARVHAALMAEALNALVNNPAHKLMTPHPANHSRMTSAGDVFSDDLGDDEALTVLRILGMLDRGQGGSPECRLLAQGLLSTCAKRYADFYADEVAHG
jgi:hypothetical protein